MLFNIVGYRFVFAYLEKKSTEKLDLAIDKGNYDHQNLIEIKIPLNMPYVSDKDYEDAYGETEINGTNYQYVKRKISQNILYLLCLPNYEKNMLVAAKHTIEKNAVQLDNKKSNQKNPVTFLSKALQQEYVQTNYVGLIYVVNSSYISFPKTSNTKAGDLFPILTPSQPPEYCI